MRYGRRYIPIQFQTNPLGDSSLGLKGYCQLHRRHYRLNVVNNGRIEAGTCPECNPPKPPAEPEGGSK